MHHRQMTLVPERLQRRHRWVETEESIQIDDMVVWNTDGRAVLILGRLPVRHHHVQPIGRATLEDHNQLLSLRLCRGRLRQYAPRQEGRSEEHTSELQSRP